MISRTASKDDAFDLTDKVAVVTGAGRGIGRACALQLAGAGANVVLASRTTSELQAVAAEVEALGSKALVVPCDVAEYSACSDVARSAFDTFGRIDVLVNNAGTGAPCPVLEAEPEEWAGVIALNLIGPFNMSRAVLPHMIDSGGGRIIMIGSGLGHSPMGGLTAYGSSKAGMSHFMKALSDEVWEHGIDVNEVIPGPVATKLTEALVTVGEAPEGLPSERVKSPYEVAELVGWLAQQRIGGPTGQIFSLARRAL
ncbi:SDR family NAD(P)-dependent oxidoreductase [Rhodococcus tukisamuensis]|uniref:3-oxoacyl-[acyl-carrier-protein] reductase MabA n=1 Tax=Rhodococcus tukisamuensis TaxID=168276 RepID=A0A1G7EQP5_9NOCA|nr:SDR family oxidoreductase [Rhodococcus tukisamuensis]SDE66018.1 3-oxoacyl-[acyl-carrier protein] reductase [Rhodococcus tukisamuensis]